MNSNQNKNNGMALVIHAILFILIGASAFFAFTKASSDYDLVFDEEVENIVLAENISKQQQLLVASERAYLLLMDISFLKDKKEINKQIDADMKKLASNLTSNDAKSLLEEAKEAREAYNQLMDHSVSETNNGNRDNSMQLVKDAEKEVSSFEGHMEELIEQQHEQMKEAKESNEGFLKMMSFILLGLSIVSIIISFLVGRNKN